MSEDNKELIQALKEHTEALNNFVENHTTRSTITINYTELLKSIESSLEEIRRNTPKPPLGKY